jgi:hypothetical protein
MRWPRYLDSLSGNIIAYEVLLAKYLKGGYFYYDLYLGRRITLEIDLEEVDLLAANWVYLTDDKDKSWAPVNSLMDFSIPCVLGIY